MLINFSNHPTDQWDDIQARTAAEKYGSVVDIEFPDIRPEWSREEVSFLAQKYVREIIRKNPDAVHIMGEMTFTFTCVALLRSYGITALASTSERITVNSGATKTTIFRFIQFREY